MCFLGKMSSEQVWTTVKPWFCVGRTRSVAFELIGILTFKNLELYIHNMLAKHKHLELPQASARLLFARFPPTSNNISSERPGLFLLGNLANLIFNIAITKERF